MQRLVGASMVIIMFTGLLVAGDLVIRISPQTLVLSSVDGSFTIHTSTSYLSEGNQVSVWIDGAFIEMDSLFPDDRGNLVAQCSKQKVKAVIEEFNGKTTTVLVEVEANGLSGSQRIKVKK